MGRKEGPCICHTWASFGPGFEPVLPPVQSYLLTRLHLYYRRDGWVCYLVLTSWRTSLSRLIPRVFAYPVQPPHRDAKRVLRPSCKSPPHARMQNRPQYVRNHDYVSAPWCEL